LLLATVGAKTGAIRTTPLAAIPRDDDLAVIGSGSGSRKIPGWVHNLRANPEATVSYQDRVVPVVGREVDQTEHDEIFAAATRIYPGFAGYRQRADYLIPVFVLTASHEQ
jgi:deazaflavin-dependent oxidoreductase (nitroreductase family)